MSPSTLRAIGVVATLWNLVGVASYLAHVGLFGEAAAAPPEGGAEMPVAITAAFAIAVFAGAIGSMGIALLKRWAEPVLWISLIATLIDWVWVFLYSGAASVPLGVAVVVIAIILPFVAKRIPAS
ncbi:MAG TPA: hypothetical protein VGN36_06970 [Sphingorhabdus sp.]|nr:hypothetical protein [Sphingorhabdus sp.]